MDTGSPAGLSLRKRPGWAPAKVGESWGAVAVRRALMFRIGSQGLTCAAYEVAIEAGTEDREGTIRPVRDCPNPVAEVVSNTGLCADCASMFRTAMETGNVRVAEKIDKS